MSSDHFLSFEKEIITSKFIAPSGEDIEKRVEVRINPVSGRTSRIAFGRGAEKEPGTESLPLPPPNADDTAGCPFCKPQVMSKTPRILADIFPGGRFCYNNSILFPNLFPYGRYSAVSLFDNQHFVEIGASSVSSYADCFINCRNYLCHILESDPEAVYMAITQNHLPSAGGSLLHPHLQINAERIASNHHRFFRKRAEEYFHQTGSYLFSDYLLHEKRDGSRYIGKNGSWEWIMAFAPEGFFEIWGILPKITSLYQIMDEDWNHLAQGVINTQKFYRSLCRNGYNLGMLFVEDGNSYLEMRVVILARSNYAPWVRNDHTGFEIMLGDMTTFTSPEDSAKNARIFWT
ncbi:MAG: galactose-1-phosphate uridylyltransferase [Deltaproteobacteria bacterium]|nr:galactose-1-phosphate uridylyltransferase [Deltaproteobacteria bacterium]